MSRHGVCFAAGCGLWGWALEVVRNGLPGRSRPRRLRPRRHQGGRGAADVEALGGGLDARNGAAVGVPGFRLVAGLSKAAQARLLVERAAGANVVGRLIDQPVEHGVAGQTEDEVDPVLVAPLHHFGAAIMAVAANGDPGLWPVPANATDEAAQDRKSTRLNSSQHIIS